MEWADKYRYLSPESSAVPGKWKTATVEAARGPMLEATNPKCHTITIMCCTQLMKTELINNIAGYYIHQDPAPLILMQPTKSLAETWSKERFDKMVRDTPVLREKVLTKRRGDSDNTIWNKSFPGGQLNIIGANSPTELASRPVRVVLMDEIDKYPASAGKEGDPIKLIEERTDTFWNAKKIRACSPTVEGMSRIAEEWEDGDQRLFHGRCPHCRQYENLIWDQITYEKDNIDDSTYYECSHCGVLWDEVDRMKAINEGKYIALKPFIGHASFKANKISSPWQPLSVLVHKYFDAKDDPEKLKTFYNTQLAETWKVKADAPDHDVLYGRREMYDINKIPKDVLFLTAGVDVQANRLELEIVGWKSNKESYSIDYRVIPGQTSDVATWDLLSEVLHETWIGEHEIVYNISLMTVDTGYNTQHVYNWVRKQDPMRVRAIKGTDRLKTIFGKPTDQELNFDGKRIQNALQLWPVGVSHIKSELYSWLKLNVPTDDNSEKPGYCHFPQYDVEYFKGLCSEQLVETKKRGYPVLYWEKKYPRNEPLDVRVYARAAASMFGLDRYNHEELLRIVGLLTPKNVSKSSIVEDDNDLDSNGFWENSDKKDFW